VALIGARLGLPVVPVRLEGFERVLHHTWWVPRPGRVRVTFGPPLRLEGHDYARLAAQVERAVAAIGSSNPRTSNVLR
jgi:long-chain acyl-CoA synthetase